MKKRWNILVLTGMMWLVSCRPVPDVQLGDVYHADGTFSEQADSLRGPLGIVFAGGCGPDSTQCYVISLEEAILPLTDYTGCLPGDTSRTVLSGIDNTRVWLELLEGELSPVVSLLESFGENWFVPSVGEWDLLLEKRKEIQERMERTPLCEPLRMGQYWSSNPYQVNTPSAYATVYDLYSREIQSYLRKDSCRVRLMGLVKGRLIR